jgi:hypothetical protein
MALAWDGGVRHLVRQFPFERQRNKVVAVYAAFWLLLQQVGAVGSAETGDPLRGRWAAQHAETPGD